MSIINSANPGSQINLLCMIYRVIHRSNGKFSAEEISELCRPAHLPTKEDHKKRFAENLRFWGQQTHQLWDVDEKSRLVLLNGAASATPEDIAAATSDALHKEIHDDLFKTKNHDTTPLFRCLGTILVADAYTFDSGVTLTNAELDQLFTQLGVKYPPNDSEKKYVLAYGHFLGYLEPAGSDGYVVDVTRAVRREIREVMGKDKTLSSSIFLDKLAAKLPLLDGGNYQEQVRAKARNRAHIDREERAFSRALSLALDRLRLSGLIMLEHQADDPNAYVLQTADRRELVSQIELQ